MPLQIVSHASPIASVPDDVVEKVNNCGIGMLSSWAPQQAILSHAVRFSHSGSAMIVNHPSSTGHRMVRVALRPEQFHRSNDVRRAHVRFILLRALSLFVSQFHCRICWPFLGDQPYIALHASANLNVAYELFEVRSGPGRGPVHRLGRAPEGTVDAVRRRLRGVDGQGNIVGKLWEEVAKAVMDTVRMAGRGLV